MATASSKFLPFGKRYHIFFFHSSSERDSKWTKNIIEEIESERYVAGSNGFNFSFRLSIFRNIHLALKLSVVIAFVLSHDSTNSEDFIYLLENVVASKFLQKRKKTTPMIPVLLDDCEIPECLLQIQPLDVSHEKTLWWQKLMKVLEDENPSSSSGESDEELDHLLNELMITLARKSIRKQKNFQKKFKESVIANFPPQCEKKKIKIISESCGIEIISQSLVLEWETFVNIMARSEDAVLEIKSLDREINIKNIVINLTKEGEAKLFEYCMANRKNLVKFFEHALNYDFDKTEYDRMTYNVKFQGHTGYDLLHLANNIVRNLYLRNFQKRTTEFNSLDKRIKTFENSPFDHEKCNMLAEAGFIYSGVSDTITCHCCNQSLFGSFKADTSKVIAQHSRWNTDCKYLTKKYPVSEYDTSLRNPYLPPAFTSTKEREVHSLTAIKNQELAAELAKSGFVAISATLESVLVVCTSCHYEHCVHEDVSVIKDLQFNHMIWSGENCPFLVEDKGVVAIRNFMRECKLKGQYRSSIIFEPVMMKRNP